MARHTSTSADELSPLGVRIAQTLLGAHTAGMTEVPLRDLAESLGVTVTDVASVVSDLIHAGFCDKLETNDSASLSSMGMKAARSAGNAKPSRESGGSLHSAEVSGAEWLVTLQLAAEHWSEVVRAADLGEVEKGRLERLGTEFFSHPAAVELLRRAIIRSGRKG